jgi:TolB-like protein
VTEKRVERRLSAILAADVAGYSRLTGADEEGTVSRLRALRHELIDPLVTAHGGRIVKHTGDGRLIEFASVVAAVRCAVEVQRGMTSRNANVAPDKWIEFRVGIHLGDVMVESDGDLMGDGVNIAARLEGIAEPGGICLSEDAWRQVRDKVSEQFIDFGNKELKNIARPVRVYSFNGRHESGSGSPAAEKPGPPRLSIVVLPFANIGGDPDQDYFVDGVTESLTTDLSRIAGSFVIARNTAFTYKGKPIDVKQIGRELGVRYVLEGSVQRGGNRMRVNVQLIDAESGNHLWAERFDKPLADLFDMQDEIVARLAGALNTRLIAAEAARADRAPNPDSIDLYFQGMASINKGITPAYLAEAGVYFDRALTLDPGNVEALIGRAYVDGWVGALYWGADRAARLAAAETALIKALSLAPEHAFAHLTMGLVQIYTNRMAQGIAEGERALTLDRNLALAHAIIANGKIFAGRSEDVEAHVQEALRLSPRDTSAYIWMGLVAGAKVGLDAADEAAHWANRAIEANRNHPFAHFFLAAALAQLGRLDEARAATAAGLALDPAFTVARWRGSRQSTNPIYIARRERYVDAFRKAGVPEG